MNRKQVGQRLREARLRTGLTEVQVCALTGVSTRTIRAYEHGDRLPGALALGKLTKLYAISADWVLGDEGREQPDSTPA